MVVLGLESKSGPNLNNVSKEIDKIIVHPLYNFIDDFNEDNNNDMALLKLSSPVNFTDYIQPVCLASANSTFYTGVSSWVVGFGDISIGKLTDYRHNDEVRVPVVGNNECKCAYPYYDLADNTICAGFRKDGCQEDSGGPMMIKKGSVWVQSGIVSFGKGCTLPNVPGVYVRVSQFEDWIKNHTGSSKPGFVDYMSSGVDSDLDFVCPSIPTPTQHPYPTTHHPHTTDDDRCHSQQQPACGQAPNKPRIVGGQNAAAGSWPWVASIQAYGKHRCGGSLISDMWVLIDAYCIINQPENIMVVLGLESMSGPNLNKVSKAIDKIIVHPLYNVFNDFNEDNNNDMALLKLSSPVNFTDYIQPVCLASANSTFYTGVSSWVVGFGATSSGKLTDYRHNDEVRVPVVGNHECKCAYPYITDNIICAGFRAGGKDSCQGGCFYHITLTINFFLQETQVDQ
ncbi:hypothetical protein F7725_004818 [Dissostichus mawsoni]|uniref:Peptidase S1 domain-containing protein n=1 Tax=Dissostichus mawsoni TaxID=36200 RepID=A0A7J5XJY2_DISMA|nr:hypothetical protein F7725_004818 [Dissostichus mawsoni]